MSASVPGGLAERRREPQDFTTRDFRDTVGAFATGVNVITTRSDDALYGMTASAFSSVSLDPPLALICIGLLSEGSEAIRRNGVFAVNVLSAQQEPLSRYFASKDRPRGRDAFRGVSHREVVSGSPVLDGAAAYLDCRLAATHEAGDHLIFIGEVLGLGVEPDAEPLVFHRGRYASLTHH
ncbi:MAG: flavin reductase family protein [Actinomycetota bacterium]|nr:flavin reductase family protein [Actinomycetota bacterium]